MNRIFKIDKSQLEDFYQSKFNYYRYVSFYSAVLSVLMETLYFVTDCQIFGRFATETLIPRFSVLIPMLLLIIFNKRIHSYKLGTFLYYLFPHFAMWATIWAIWYLPNRDFAREGFIIMHFAFLAVGFAMPLKHHIIAHGFIFLNIIISNLWIHYETFDMMLSLAAPLYIGCILMLAINQVSYADHYLVLKQKEKDSVTDQLTGVFNRNILSEIIDDENTVTSHVSGVVVLMIDLDKFKNVNDTFGHEAGDKMLRFLSDQIKKSVRSSDYVIRWGGEEFVVFLMDASVEFGLTKAEEIRKTVESSDTGVCPITVSIGVSEYCGEDYHDTIKKVDRALYYAKGHGRNRVVLESDI
ncbi:MAG: GGDEF domain-containing protein [Eubacterium sp.]|nr:GGDEF domain-containing protein [Eubacterium sp.]